MGATDAPGVGCDFLGIFQVTHPLWFHLYLLGAFGIILVNESVNNFRKICRKYREADISLISKRK
jgi:hypothetical protein